jgi:hypothetical protein
VSCAAGAVGAVRRACPQDRHPTRRSGTIRHSRCTAGLLIASNDIYDPLMLLTGRALTTTAGQRCHANDISEALLSLTLVEHTTLTGQRCGCEMRNARLERFGRAARFPKGSRAQEIWSAGGPAPQDELAAHEFADEL